MAEIRPFRGVRYNQSLVKDPASLICPPYDIITPPMRQALHQRSEYNFVRLEDGFQFPQDNAADSKYTRAAAIQEQWLKEAVLKVDEIPAFYLYDHYFTYQGKEYRRRGLTCCVKLEPWHKMVIRPHEGTLVTPKSDRLSLLWALQANTSPILALVDDPGQEVASVLEVQGQSRPLINITGADGEKHYLWAITESAVIERLRKHFAPRPLYIADGHHRYESALTYQRERRSCASVSEDAALNFVMMTLIDFTDPGLIILPPHRLVRGLSSAILDGLMARLESLFEVKKLPLAIPGVWQQADSLGAETDPVQVGVFGLIADNLVMLKLHDFTLMTQMMPYFHSELYKRLGVSIVDHVILEGLLGLSGDQQEAAITYGYDKLEAVEKVVKQEYQLAFLLGPVKAEVVKAIADAGDRMPRKSTYFYPKLPAGLVFNRLV